MRKDILKTIFVLVSANKKALQELNLSELFLI